MEVSTPRSEATKRSTTPAQWPACGWATPVRRHGCVELPGGRRGDARAGRAHEGTSHTNWTPKKHKKIMANLRTPATEIAGRVGWSATMKKWFCFKAYKDIGLQIKPLKKWRKQLGCPCYIVGKLSPPFDILHLVLSWKNPECIRKLQVVAKTIGHAKTIGLTFLGPLPRNLPSNGIYIYIILYLVIYSENQLCSRDLGSPFETCFVEPVKLFAFCLLQYP